MADQSQRSFSPVACDLRVQPSREAKLFPFYNGDLVASSPTGSEASGYSPSPKSPVKIHLRRQSSGVLKSVLPYHDSSRETGASRASGSVKPKKATLSAFWNRPLDSRVYRSLRARLARAEKVVTPEVVPPNDWAAWKAMMTGLLGGDESSRACKGRKLREWYDFLQSFYPALQSSASPRQDEVSSRAFWPEMAIVPRSMDELNVARAAVARFAALPAEARGVVLEMIEAGQPLVL